MDNGRKNMKDNFSSNSNNYAKFRPNYPKELFEWINSIVREKNCAWDCGTGTGQIAIELARNFKEIKATDISESQLREAPKHSRIEYSQQPAEKTNFPNEQFDLIIIGQAIHWFDFDEFYKETNRTLKPNGIIIATGYNRPLITPEIDKVITRLYTDILGEFWDKERKYIDENYKTIPFPYHEMEAPALVNMYGWTIDHLKGYLQTWSAVKHFTKAKAYDPVESISEELKRAWGEQIMREIKFPVLLRAGKK
jgi:ubiquinone/menaquinone biosynthesis C-methylase UbiE